MEENLVNQQGEIRVPITVSKFLLKEGDVLDEDILYYHNLRKGTILSKEFISAIQQIDGIDTVRVLRLKKIVEEEVEKKVSLSVSSVSDPSRSLEALDAVKDTDIKLGFSDEEANRKIAESIRRTIEMIRGRDYESKVENTSQKIEEIVVKEQITSQTMKQEVERTIREISESFVDTFSLQKIVPIRSKADVMALNFSNKSISNYFLDLVVADRVMFINSAKSIVVKFINSFGDDNSGIVLSSLFQFSENDDYVVSHSIFVMAMSILIAKELTKLAYDKLSQSDNKVDPRSLKVISQKTFDIDDLTNIGLISILHDVGLRKNFGSILPSFRIPATTVSKVELHPSESSFFAQKLSLDISIQRAVYEHHEFLDGSGYPKGTTRYMSKYSPIIAFTERLSELVLENPFNTKPILPALAVNHILKNELKKYDRDVVYAFVRATSTYPIGSWIEMSNNLVGFVKDVSPRDKTKQIVKAVFTSQLSKLDSPVEIDLAEVQDVKIVKVLNPIELSKKVGDIRTYYFD
ncbi:MAG: HD domain-containing phosphohydrolase [Brevinematia bacterium]